MLFKNVEEKINISSQKIEYGDWQTPYDLANQIVMLLTNKINPDLIFEPNCGKGVFLQVVLDKFPNVRKIIGLEINPFYVSESKKILDKRIKIIQGNFFEIDWVKYLEETPGPILIIGNPPWATNSELMRLRSNNIPIKYNINSIKGIDAITGKSNFDISEWMLIKEFEALQGKNAILAMLCKRTIARKVLLYAWNKKLSYNYSEIRKIDAKKHFGVSVDACLFIVNFNRNSKKFYDKCFIYEDINSDNFTYSLGYYKGKIVNNITVINRYPELINDMKTKIYWRSGIKHDCSKIMEFIINSEGKLINGYDREVDLEDELLFPVLKSSDLANGKIDHISKVMLVTQKKVGDDTNIISLLYPKTWNYLLNYARNFDERKSSIYRNKPRFSIFGVGEYSFEPWKVAISGLYKTLNFRIVGPYNGKPVVFDDTCYFISFKSEIKAKIIKKILDSDICLEILKAFVFFDSKRPVTKETLDMLNLPAIAKYLGIYNEFKQIFSDSF